jgi:hypothetical protein
MLLIAFIVTLAARFSVLSSSFHMMSSSDFYHTTEQYTVDSNELFSQAVIHSPGSGSDASLMLPVRVRNLVTKTILHMNKVLF